MRSIGLVIILIILIVATPCPASASEPGCSNDPLGLRRTYDLRVGDIFKTPAQTQVRQVRAFGTHKCQSETSIGHSCQVTGLFTSCDEAFHVLKRQDCCPSTKEKGTSIEFRIVKCSSF